MNINFDDALNAAKNAAQSAKASLGEGTDALKDTISGLKDKLHAEKTTGVEAADNVINKAKGMAADALQKGSDLLDGLADKLK